MRALYNPTRMKVIEKTRATKILKKTTKTEKTEKNREDGSEGGVGRRVLEAQKYTVNKYRSQRQQRLLA